MIRAGDKRDTGTDFDVVIAGGGLVGGSLAVALAQTSLRVALVEAIPADSSAQPSFDDRTIALSHGSCNILRQLGLWPLLQASVFPIQRIHVSESRRFGTTLIDAGEQGIAELGHVIKGRALGAALWQRINELPNLHVFCPASADRTSMTDAADSGPQSRQLHINTADGEQLVATRLLVVADGARSALRDALGVQSRCENYDQTAIVANVQVDASHAGHTAYERFTPAGPLAVLPGQEGRYTVVLARATEVAEELLAIDDSDYLAELQRCLGFRLGRLRKLGRRVAYPLSLVQTESLTAPRAVMIGNAAHGLHPVAGQGFNLGLRDVASLAELLADGIASQSHAVDTQTAVFDAGSPDLLQTYTDWRSHDQRKVVTFTDGLIRTFGRPGAGLAVGRGLGLALFDILPVAKRELARQTMGLAGRMSRLARGLPL